MIAISGKDQNKNPLVSTRQDVPFCYATFSKSSMEYTRVRFSKVKNWSSSTIHF